MVCIHSLQFTVYPRQRIQLSYMYYIKIIGKMGKTLRVLKLQQVLPFPGILNLGCAAPNKKNYQCTQRM